MNQIKIKTNNVKDIVLDINEAREFASRLCGAVFLPDSDSYDDKRKV